jgi:diguanylate cyclase (GGDEF)-like protein/PAS domain S-box-containing protein
VTEQHPGQRYGADGDKQIWDRKFFRAVIDSMPGIFCLFDRSGGFRHWNANLETVTGYSADEIAGMSVLDLFEPDLRIQVRQAMDKALETGRASLEAPLLTRFGTTRPYSYYGSRVEIAGEHFIAGMGLDVSRLKQAQQLQAEQAQQLHHLSNHVPGVIYQLRLDPDSGLPSIPFASAKIFEVLGVRHEQVRDNAQILFDRVYSGDIDRVNRAMDISARELTPFRQQFRLCPPGGLAEHAEWVEVESTPERLADGATVWHGFARLITERRRMEEELSQLAYNDSLTGLPNRTSLQISLEKQIADASLIGHGLALLHLDLDNFKDINDAWGHSAGDRLLVELAHRFSECAGKEATLGRIGGDEFLIIAEGADPAGKAEELAAGLCRKLASPIELDRRVVRVTGSIGISLFPRDGENTEDLLRHADAALYRAKAQGPGTWAMYTPELTAAAMARRYLETELSAAIDNNELKVALQPIVRVADRQVCGYEALARWHHRDDGWIDPEQFIDLAESRGLVTALGNQVYAKAMREVAAMDEVSLAINVAPAQLRAQDFATSLLELADKCGLDPARLEIEITERVLMSEGLEALAQINLLRQANVSIAIDDFGTGFSSLAYLRRLPIQRMKIDQSFVRNVDQVRENAAIVRAIVTLARELDLKVTAEGVQTAAELTFIQDVGCDTAQGWYFGRGRLVGGHQSSQSSSSSQAS